MNEINKTLYIPLYGKAVVSAKGVILHDKKAEEIWQEIQFALKRKSRSKWLAYYMSMRAKVFDEFVLSHLNNNQEEYTVLHLGCGLDSRVMRVNAAQFPNCSWFDVDFPQVIEERKKYFQETPHYRMLGADLKSESCLNELPPSKKAIVIMEGVAMYLTNEDLSKLFRTLDKKFSEISLLVDVYTEFGAKISKYKNPVNEVSAHTMYGLNEPTRILLDTAIQFVQHRELTPVSLINELKGAEKFTFKKLFAGNFSKKLYRMYEYKKQST
ncbi:MAG: class I SAM-dependent methyltransferase [Clostridia bacterium]|nr:class I SAM-dependent methyltransferase [Clostridia bacterium]